MKRRIAILLSVLMVFSSVASISAATDDEIEKRIDKIMEEDLRYYREGRDYGREKSASGFLGFAGGANAAAAVEEYDSIEYEDGADYAMAESSNEDVYAEAAAPEAGSITGSSANSKDAGSIAGEGYSDSYSIDLPEPGPYSNEEYSPITEHGYVSVLTQPFSTFGADVDTASYATMRRKLVEPYAMERTYVALQPSSIRIEEMVNYFKYNYKAPENGEKFGVTTVLTKCPWNEDALLLKVGVKGEEYQENEKGSNIVFLVDTSGSMFDFDKLPLVKNSIDILQKRFSENDRISIVTYAGSEEVLAEGLSGSDHGRIMEAVSSMEAWGSTWGEGGINKAYEIAEKYFIEGGNNRVILCTDGDFNVGVSSEAGLKELISKKRESGIFFSCLGFGEGNYSDTTMETLADNGNGNYFYIDSPREAEKALNEEFFSTIYTVAKDAKFQIEFNPETVKGYRQIGYENRAMSAEDFADDTKDGGEVGAGTTVTVLYEIIPADSDFEIPTVTSKYQKAGSTGSDNPANSTSSTNFDTSTDSVSTDTATISDELLTVNIRYKEPDEDTSVLREYPVSMADFTEEMDQDTSWAAGVAQAGMLMRDSEYAGTSSFEAIYDRLKENEDIMEDDYKAEFMFLLRLMKQYKG